MEAVFDLPERYAGLRNDLFLLTGRWRDALLYMHPLLHKVAVTVSIVQKHVLPFTSGPLVTSGIAADGTLFSITIRMHREVSDELLTGLLATELKKYAGL